MGAKGTVLKELGNLEKQTQRISTTNLLSSLLQSS